jgi:hypothetical protein
LGADLKAVQFQELETKFTHLLGEPDEVSIYYDLGEPKWEVSDVSLRLYYVDSHCGGYEFIGLEIPILGVGAGS